MSHTQRLTISSELMGESVSNTISETASSPIIVTESVADSQTDFQINVAIDVTAVKSFYIVSDQDVTIETNSGSAADNTLALKAGEPYIFHVSSLDTFLLDTDVTAFFVTNASGSTANIKVRGLQDATP